MPSDAAKEVARKLLTELAIDYRQHRQRGGLPTHRHIQGLCEDLFGLLIRGYRQADRSEDDIGKMAEDVAAFQAEIRRATLSVLQFLGNSEDDSLEKSHGLCDGVLDDLASVHRLITTDIEAAFANDPAAAERSTIVLAYPSIQALAIQRFAHRLYQRGLPIIPRLMTEVVHGRTGIDIHPGAAIGESCFIDHGTGVVIGETARIGSHCVLYQGVGLIAWNPLAKDEHGELRRGASNQRHPTLEDHVTVYAGASILGGDTVIGHHSVIGGNVWLTRSVDPYSVVTAEAPALTIRQRGKR